MIGGGLLVAVEASCLNEDSCHPELDSGSVGMGAIVEHRTSGLAGKTLARPQIPRLHRTSLGKLVVAG